MVTHVQQLTVHNIFILIFILLLHLSHASDYGGCGGTVTVAPELSRFAKTKVDFTVVKVKLLSSAGVLKYTTECAPTGHYFVPTYDKGSFFLVIEGPAGWNFEPSRVPVTIGEDSPCGDKINFQFTGFSLRGKVSGSGASTKEGPQGVTLTLFSEGSQVGTAVSDETGSYVFHNVYPGSYEITASHPRWQISPSKIKTQMEWNNFEVGTSFVVSGFSVTGSVLSGEEPVPEVDFYLYSETISSAGCTAPPADAPKGKSKGKLLCVAKSNSKGDFLFSSVPSGDYTLVPIYSSAHTTFDVAPAVASLHVGNRDSVVTEPFRVVGFGVSGKVLAGTSGIENARVLVNGVEKAVTGKGGSYRLEQFKAGAYDITVEKPNYVFGALKGERVSANNPRISDIRVTEVSVCGTLSIANPPPNVKLGVRDVQIKGEGASFKQKTVQAEKDGKYCTSLPAGTYTITPIVTSSEEKAGLNFSPPSATIEVASTPLNDINFSQLRVTVAGRVVCLASPCDKSVSVTLHPNSPAANSASSITTGLGLTDNQFTVRDVLPGSYKISVNFPNDAWCWETQSRELSVTKDTANIEFVQSGYVLPVTSPHGIQLHVTDKKGAGETHSLHAGNNKVCVNQPGKYTVTPKSCFKFGQDSFDFDTTSPRPIELRTSHILVQGTVSAGQVSSIQVKVLDSAQGNVLETLTTTPQQDKTHRYEYWALPGASLKFAPSTPTDSSLLPHPPSREYTVPETTTACLSPLPAFEMRKGQFLNGQVIPGISGVRIGAKGANGEEIAHVLTASDGSYSVGPLYEGEHTVYAQKEDFHFQRDETGLIFRAAKLGRLRVLAVDAVSGDPVPGVLLSLSGEGYSNNSAIPAGGALVFSDLFPGDYFLRAHLKEYSFHPSHASITVVEGQEATHKFLVTRVAFSCFGSVKGMNSLPERGVVVLAQPTASDSTASLEETQTDNSGNFRLRGLVPGVTYSIFVKNAVSSTLKSTTGDIAIPESLVVTIGKEDIRNTDFVVIRKPQYFDILGCVNVSNEHLHTLTASLYDSRSPDSVIKAIPLGCTKTFLFNDIPSKVDTDYIVRLTSTLSPRSYQISISPSVTVQTKQISTPRTKCLPFTFHATVKHDVTEVPVQGLSSFIILLVLPVLAFRYRVQLMPIAKLLYMKYLAFQAKRAGVAPTKQQQSRYRKTSKDSSQNEFDFLPPELLNNFNTKSKQKTKTK